MSVGTDMLCGTQNNGVAWVRWCSVEMLLEAAGVLIVTVPGLRSSVCYIEGQRVCLVRDGLPSPARREALEWAFGEACADREVYVPSDDPW